MLDAFGGLDFTGGGIDQVGGQKIKFTFLFDVSVYNLFRSRGFAQPGQAFRR
ncbi:MAG: hypothetical protein PHE84_10060 [bacterium]|nr:hypothetical protein [bacterium]